MDGLLTRDLQIRPEAKFAFFIRPLPSRAKQLSAQANLFRRRLLKVDTVTKARRRSAPVLYNTFANSTHGVRHRQAACCHPRLCLLQTGSIHTQSMESYRLPTQLPMLQVVQGGANGGHAAALYTSGVEGRACAACTCSHQHSPLLQLLWQPRHWASAVSGLHHAPT